MVADTALADLEQLVARLAAAAGADERARILQAVDPAGARAAAERLKKEADRARYQDTALALRWCGDVVSLGTLAGAPTVVALGRMAEGAVLREQGHYRDSLACFDEASALFRAHGDEVGWARVQIGRTGACMALARFEEALQRAEEARLILERAGEDRHVASIDSNLALLLQRMSRPADALVYGERALAAYGSTAWDHRAVGLLCNYALSLWRLGRVREALAAHEQARQGYVALDASLDAAREDLNIGVAYLALGRYAEAVSTLTAARRELLAAGSPVAAVAGLHLAECLVRLGRYAQAAGVAAQVHGEFVGHEDAVQGVQALMWQALAHAGQQQHQAALHALDAAAALLAVHPDLHAHAAILDLCRAQLLLQRGLTDEARRRLEDAIPVLREAGLTIETATAQVAWGDAMVGGNAFPAARAAAAEALDVARREGLDWLAARAAHLHGRVELRRGNAAGAWSSLSAAVRHLDRVHRRVAWDDRAAFGDTAAVVYADAVALALRQGRPLVALHYAERAKARALADHLRGHVDVRPRAHDERSRVLVDELQALRERYAWLGAARRDTAEREAPIAAVRWATPAPLDQEAQAEASQVEERMAAIWRELQASNPAYRGEAAALDPMGAEEEDDPDDDAAQRWAGRVQAALGPDDRAALFEYVALGDDLVLFVLRGGATRAVRLEGASTAVRRLVPLLRLNVERSAAAVVTGSAAFQGLEANARGVLQRLHAVLLAPAEPLLDGASRLVVVPHGASHHVPFHALHDGRAYLVERMEVSYAPCGGLLAHFAGRQRLLGTAGRDRLGAVALAYSDGGALPHVAAEAATVTAALGGRLLGEDEATLHNLRAAAGAYTALHLAAHGVFRPDDPLFSALQLADGPLSTLDVFDLELRCSLVTLSACETALGVTGAGDELMGLSRAFLYAGAPSLVLSLWKVEDRSTAALMDVFYRALRDGAGKAAALRRAQLALLHDGAGHSAPYFWAPFELIGHAGPLAD